MRDDNSKTGPSESNFDAFDDGENGLGDGVEVASSVRSDEDENMESLESAVEREAESQSPSASSARGDETFRNISFRPSPMYLTLEPQEKRVLFG